MISLYPVYGLEIICIPLFHKTNLFDHILCINKNNVYFNRKLIKKIKNHITYTFSNPYKYLILLLSTEVVGRVDIWYVLPYFAIMMYHIYDRF